MVILKTEINVIAAHFSYCRWQNTNNLSSKSFEGVK